MTNKPVLAYWNIRGLGHPIRYLLHYLEVDFEDKHYDCSSKQGMDIWYAEKEKLRKSGLPLPNLPYFLDGTHKLTESRVIMKHLCRTRRPELLGKTPDIQTRAEMADNFIYDFLVQSYCEVIYRYTEEKMKNYKENIEPTKLGYLSDFMKDSKWVAGNDITYVDFLIYEILFQFTVYDAKALDKFPKILAFMKQFEEIPSIKAYMNSSGFLTNPCFMASAAIKI